MPIINVVFAEARVDAVDDVVEVFVDQHGSGAEDDEVEVEDREGVVEVGLGEDQADDPLDLGEPKGDWGGLVESSMVDLYWNQRLVGSEQPIIIPAARLRAARVPVESRMCWLIGEPRAIWFGVMSHL